MIGRIEIAYSTDCIRRAKTRVLHQQSVVESLQINIEPDHALCAKDLLKRMERKLTSLQAEHRSLLVSTTMARCSPLTSHEEAVLMQNPLTRKLETFSPLDEDDKGVLDDIVRASRIVDAGHIINDEGEEPTTVHLVIEGIAYRYKQLSDGKRQTVAYMVPGDLCDMHGFFLKHMDHSIAAMSRCRIVDIPRHRVLELCGRPAIQRALWCATLIEEAVLWEWLVNMGSRNSEKRLAHFFCEMFVRLRGAGWASATVCPLPLTQADLGETLGLSTVHINRTMQTLSGTGLVKKKMKSLFIPDFEKLVTFAGFDPTYLYFKGGRPAEQVATTYDIPARADTARVAHSPPQQH